MSSLARRATAEMTGTALLVFFGAGAVIMDSFPSGGYHLFGIAVVYGLVTGLAVSMTMGISGGHVNPAVTIAMLVIRRITAREAFIYVVSQLAGALIAGFLVRWLVAPNVGHVIGYGSPRLSSAVTFWQGAGLEAILTFVLMSAMMATVFSARGPRIGGLGVAMALIPAVMVGGSLTSGVLNPARAFGPAVAAGNATAQGVWWIGPIVGAVVAALLWQYVLGRDAVVEEVVIVETE
jgi:MIP family channel proteins